MFWNNLKIAIRNMRRQLVYSSINVFGLAVAMACCVMIMLFLQDELSFDRFHENSDRIYRVGYQGEFGSDIRRLARTPVPLAQGLESEFAAVERAIRIRRVGRPLVRYQDRRFYEESFFWTDPGFFQVFTFPFYSGDVHTALADPYSVILTRSAARRYFAEDNPLGKTLSVLGIGDFHITGIVEDLPLNSHIQFDMLTNFETMAALGRVNSDGWDSFVLSTYVLLAGQADPVALEAELPRLLSKHSDRLDPATHFFFLDPVSSLHFENNLTGELGVPGDITLVYVLGIVAAFVLLIACINFMNLATARSLSRAREIGVRKVLGSNRRRLAVQFLGEAVCLSMLALAVSQVLIELFLPAFNSLTAKQLSLNFWDDKAMLLVLAAIGIGVGLISGSYPALYLSGLQPAQTLKGDGRGALPGSRARRVLVVTQFSIAIILMAGTFVTSAQYRLFQNKHLGFEKAHQVILALQSDRLTAQLPSLKASLLENPNVLAAAGVGHVPGQGRGVYQYALEGQANLLNVVSYFCDADFLSTLGIQLQAGRDFLPKSATDSRDAFIANESAIKAFGWGTPEDAIGKRVTWDGSKTGRLVGVIDDFHFQSLHTAIDPLIIQINPGYLRFLIIKIRAGDIPETLAQISDTYSAFDPDHPAVLSFLDEQFDQLYHGERRVSQIFAQASGLAIAIACLGLIALAAFSAEQRKKEIGIRKVLGASVGRIIGMLSREFMVLVLAANVIAWPIAWMALDKWLLNFAYRIDLGWTLFAAAGALAGAIALGTVSLQAIRAARLNPIDSIRYE